MHLAALFQAGHSSGHVLNVGNDAPDLAKIRLIYGKYNEIFR